MNRRIPTHFEHYFGNCKTFNIPVECVAECSAPGDVDEAVRHWAKQISDWPTLEDMQQDIKESGAEVPSSEHEVKRMFLWISCCSEAEAFERRRLLQLLNGEDK